MPKIKKNKHPLYATLIIVRLTDKFFSTILFTTERLSTFQRKVDIFLLTEFEYHQIRNNFSNYVIYDSNRKISNGFLRKKNPFGHPN